MATELTLEYTIMFISNTVTDHTSQGKTTIHGVTLDEAVMTKLLQEHWMDLQGPPQLAKTYGITEQDVRDILNETYTLFSVYIEPAPPTLDEQKTAMIKVLEAIN